MVITRTFILACAACVAVCAQDWETKLRAVPNPANLRRYVERMAARPHHLGSPYDKDNAEWILGRFREWGLDARIEIFEVLFPTPKERLVEMTSPIKFTAKLQEPAVAGDPTSNQYAEQLPTYNSYSADGDVTGPLVYVNHGVPEDYEQLARLGISVRGAIVIARYGVSWRGIKPKVAAEHGAVGCLIYSDPRDDGYAQGEVFPEGAYRPRDGVQRGSVMDMPLYPGDPLTPGVGATKEAKRLALKDAPTLTKIPVLPISYGDAEPLLTALKGPVAPEAWRGGLAITYRIGPGPAVVRLKVRSSWDIVALYNVIATIPGSEYPDEWIIRGNHHDAWVNGAADPASGMASVLEEARAFGELVKQGWRPKRTILFAAWDGEEQGLLGSTEWAEAHADELKRKAVAYINSDSNSRGYFNLSGSHTLEKFLNTIARDVEDPEKRISAWKRNQLRRIANSATRREARSRADLRLSALGSGSDYTVFLDHLGIASLNIGFGGDGGGGVYHSIYDDFHWYSRFGDPDFEYGRVLAQAGAAATLRLADATVLPYDFTNLADTIRVYLGELKSLWNDLHDRTEERNRQLDEGVFQATADSRKPTVPPERETVPPHLNFAPLENAAETLSAAAARYDRAARVGSTKLSTQSARELNAHLIRSERALTHADGLPNRPWFKHQIYAPGFYTGYGVKTIPGVRESIEQKQWQQAEAQIGRVAKVIESLSGVIADAAGVLERAAK